MSVIEAHKGIYWEDVVSNLPPNVVVIRNGFIDIWLKMYFQNLTKKRFFNLIVGKGKTKIPLYDRII